MTALVLDHIGIATPDLEVGSAPYWQLGLAPKGEDEVLEAQGVRARVFQAGETKIELLAPLHAESPIARFLEKNRPGLHHTAYRVADIQAEITRLKAAGATFLSDGPSVGLHGSLVIFLHPKWGAGTLIELCQPQAHHSTQQAEAQA